MKATIWKYSFFRKNKKSMFYKSHKSVLEILRFFFRSLEGGIPAWERLSLTTDQSYADRKFWRAPAKNEYVYYREPISLLLSTPLSLSLWRCLRSQWRSKGNPQRRDTVIQTCESVINMWLWKNAVNRKIKIWKCISELAASFSASHYDCFDVLFV